MINSATVIGPNSGVLTLFDVTPAVVTAPYAGQQQALADGITAGVIDGTLSEVVYDGSPLPAPSGGTSGIVVDTISGVSITLPGNYVGAIVAELGASTLQAGTADGQTIVASAGPLTFAANGGSGSVLGGGNNSSFSVDGSTAPGWAVYAHGSADTVNAAAGVTTIGITGTGTSDLSDDLVLLGSGTTHVTLGTGDTLIGGTGTAFMTLGTNDTVVDGGGTVDITSRSSDTIFGGSGAATISLSAPNQMSAHTLFVAGTGQTSIISSIYFGPPTDTIVALAPGQLSETTRGGDLVDVGQATVSQTNAEPVNLYYPEYQGVGLGAIPETVFAAAGAVSVSLTTGLLFSGGSGTLIYSPPSNQGTIAPGTIFGGSGSVTVHGGVPIYLTYEGDDEYSTSTTSGGTYTGDADLFVGGTAGDNVITAGAGTSTIFGGGAGDVLAAAYAGGDLLVGASGAETLTGVTSTGNNTFFGGSGPETMLGGSGNDILVAGAGTTSVVSGTGRNLIVLGGGADVAVANGTDTVLAGTGAASIGITGNALVFGKSAPLLFFSGGGSGTLVGGAGSETAFGGTGGGVFSGGTAGNNFLVAGAGKTTLFGGGAGDTLTATGSAGDVIVAGAGPETLTAAASNGANVLIAGTGADVIDGGSGNDIFVAGAGNATLSGGGGANLYAVTNGQAGGTLLIQDFAVGTDAVALSNYAAGTVARALAGATIADGATSIVLPDSTRLTFVGVTNLTASSFM